MPKPIIFTVRISGQERTLFTVQERSSGDLTIILKNSRFHTVEEGASSSEAFDDLKRDLAFSLFDTTWKLLSEAEKIEYAPMVEWLREFDSYTKSGRAFSFEHQQLIAALSRFTAFAIGDRADQAKIE